CDPIPRGCGRKRSVLAYRKTADPIRGRVAFLLTEEHDGWEWRGIAAAVAHSFDNRVESEVDAYELAEDFNTLDPLAYFRARGESGVDFRAGGAAEWLSEFWTGGPFRNVDQTCGWGPGGSYYGEGQHVGWDAQFAIDFSRWDRAPPFLESSSHRHVLAPAF